MNARQTIALLLLGAALAGCAKAPTQVGPLPLGHDASYTFNAPVTPALAPDGFGSEPSLLATKDGALYFTSVLGSATARGDGLWKSTDSGRNWTYLGKADYPFGGGDSDIDELGNGDLLLTGQWRPGAVPALPGVGSPYVTGGESVSHSTDGGKTWTPSPAAGYLPAADRNWLATFGDKTAWLVYNDAASGLMVGKTTDGGLTWLPPTVVQGSGSTGGVAGGPVGIAGDAVADPQDGTLYIPYGSAIGGGSAQLVYKSTDGGMTFTSHTAHETMTGEQAGAVFSTLAMDSEGGLYLVWGETHGKGMRTWLSHSQDKAETWSPAVQVLDSSRTSVFPWVVAGAPGRVTVAMYAANGSFVSDDAATETQWFPTVAFSANALDANTTFTVATLSAAPNHVGPLCTGGTGCDSQYRKLGDFFEAAILPDGRVAVVWADDTGTAQTNRVSVQATGPLMHA